MTRLVAFPALAHVVLAFPLLAFSFRLSFSSAFAQCVDVHWTIFPRCFLALVHLYRLLRAAVGQPSVLQLLEASVLVGEHDSFIQALWHQPEHGGHKAVV